MTASRIDTRPTAHAESLSLIVPLKVLAISSAYAAVLGYLERRYPIKPDHTWAEVAGGVMISLVPVALTARKAQQLDWRAYEGAVWRSFIASGTPIILWQIGEAVLRQVELLRYTTGRELKNPEPYANDSSTVASRSGERARGGSALS